MTPLVTGSTLTESRQETRGQRLGCLSKQAQVAGLPLPWLAAQDNDAAHDRRQLRNVEVQTLRNNGQAALRLTHRKNVRVGGLQLRGTGLTSWLMISSPTAMTARPKACQLVTDQSAGLPSSTTARSMTARAYKSPQVSLVISHRDGLVPSPGQAPSAGRAVPSRPG